MLYMVRSVQDSMLGYISILMFSGEQDYSLEEGLSGSRPGSVVLLS
jgi:hypothetical protein